MENKKLGVVLIVISVVLGGLFFYYAMNLQDQSKEVGCYPTDDCMRIEKNLYFTHVGVGIFSFILALGFYLLFFNKTEQAILEKLEAEKNQKHDDLKFTMLMKALDPFEKKVVSIVKEQPGITQTMLKWKADMSKEKLSYVLQELERRGIMKRVEKGKTLALYLKI